MPQKFVNVEKYGFAAEPRYWSFGWAKSRKILGRISAVKALVKAGKFLPQGYNFKIWDCKRTYDVQILMRNSFRKRLKAANPKLKKDELEKLVIKFGGRLVKNEKRLGTHRKGGSFDLTIIDGKGKELYMGTDHDDLTQKAATDFYENKKKLNRLEKEAMKNRRLLKKAMTKAGLSNYIAEWWHWSFDK